jgi:DNA anti-recombination protein RmuC
MADEWFQFYQVAQSMVMALATVLAWFWGKQQKAERDLLDGKFAQMVQRQDKYEGDVQRRFEHVNEQLSVRLVPTVQSLIGRLDRMPDELRTKFLSLDRANDLFDESRRDRAEMRKELDRRHYTRRHDAGEQ